MERIRNLLMAGVCVASGLSMPETVNAQRAVDMPARLTIDLDRASVVFSGAVSSIAHESILRQRALTLFPDKTRTFNLSQHPVLPPGWALISELTLFAVAESYSSTTHITESTIDIQGIANSSSAWPQKIEQLNDALLPGMRLQQRVVQIGSPADLRQQCAALFRSALRSKKIEFPRSGYVLSSAVFPLLDKLAQISTDCPDAQIRITGHTDSTGDESGNVFLSQARAEAIAAYLSERGIMSARITATGIGSARPATSGDTAQAQKLNRRIEIDIDFPAH